MNNAQLLSPSLRKAAVLLRSLDAESSAVLLASLSTDEARAVRQAIRELGEIDPLEQQQLRDALRPANAAPLHEEPGGVELAFSTAVVGAPEPAQPLECYAPPTAPHVAETPPFAWLDKADLPSLATMLEREHLSTVAVVLARLPADRASQVLAALPPNRRAAALERLADLGDSDEASIEVIERELADWIAAQKAEKQRRADRLRAIQAILRHSPSKTCNDVLAEIARHDRRLASEIGTVHARRGATPLNSNPGYEVGSQAASLRPAAVEAPPMPRRTVPCDVPPAPPTFPFERLTELDRGELTHLLGQCSSEVVVLALAGASLKLSKHVESLLPRNVVKELRRRMHSLSSIKLSEMAAAQEQIAHTAGRLFATKS